MSVSLLTLAEMLKCMNNQAQHVNTTCMKLVAVVQHYAFLMLHVSWALNIILTESLWDEYVLHIVCISLSDTNVLYTIRLGVDCID